MAWIWERENWTNFSYDMVVLAPLLEAARLKRAGIEASLLLFGFNLQQATYLESVTREVLFSGEIEGEVFAPEAVRSSVARRLGMDVGAVLSQDRRIEGVVEMALDATRNPDLALNRERLFHWHQLLFPEGRSGMHRITTGGWRRDLDGPMRVISGSIGKEKEHFRAPPAQRIEVEMEQFLSWFESSAASSAENSLLKSALAHFWFITIHPFDDGNGRIARAIADLQLTRAEKNTQRWYSMSAAIRKDRKSYYLILEETQRGSGDLTLWLFWYLGCMISAMESAHESLERGAASLRFWAYARHYSLNDRQRHMLSLLLEGFEGKLTSSKWAALSHCSQDTATRDINALIEAGLLSKGSAGGRSTEYVLMER